MPPRGEGGAHLATASALFLLPNFLPSPPPPSLACELPSSQFSFASREEERGKRMVRKALLPVPVPQKCVCTVPVLPLPTPTARVFALYFYALAHLAHSFADFLKRCSSRVRTIVSPLRFAVSHRNCGPKKLPLPHPHFPTTGISAGNRLNP